MEAFTAAEKLFFQSPSDKHKGVDNGKPSGSNTKQSGSNLRNSGSTNKHPGSNSGSGNLRKILRENTLNLPRSVQDLKVLPQSNRSSYENEPSASPNINEKNDNNTKNLHKGTSISLNNLRGTSHKKSTRNKALGMRNDFAMERSKTLNVVGNWKAQSVSSNLNIISTVVQEPSLPKLADVEFFDDSMDFDHDHDHVQQRTARSDNIITRAKDNPEGSAETNPGTGVQTQGPITAENAGVRIASANARAEREAKANWILGEELKTAQKLFERREHALRIVLPDEDPLAAIERRMDEVRMMSKPRRDTRHVLQRMPSAQRERVVKVKSTPLATIKKNNRKGWKGCDLFRWGARMIILLANSFRNRRKYYFDRSQMGRLRNKVEKLQVTGVNGQDGRSSMSADMQSSLTTRPELRTKKQVKHVLWLLRATKAFKHLFPAEMEAEVARHTAYEKYDDGRIIALQGRPPDRFYYILAGRMTLLRQFKLSTGQVTKPMGFLTKGMSTDPEELERQWLREDSLVAKGQVEVLILDGHAFNYLLHTTEGAPTEFLSSISLFDNFPVDDLKHHHDAFEYTYYGQGKIIVKDSNRTPWLHVVKSGTVKVVRNQPVINAEKMNESKFSSPRIEELGCGRSASHAEAMIGVSVKQKKVKNANKGHGTLVLPQIYRDGNLESVNNKSSMDKHVQEDVTDGSTSDSPTSGKRTGLVMNMEPTIFEYSDGEDTETDSAANIPVSNVLAQQDRKKRRRKSEWGVKLPLLNIPMRSDMEIEREESFQPHTLWLTRGKTELESTGQKKESRKEQPLRQAYLQLDELKPGDVFGLDHMQPALASEAHGVSLLSNGAEVVKISKRFFLSHAANNTMLKVETMYKEYVSEQEARDMLFEKETWHQYRGALWQRMTEHLRPKGSHLETVTPRTTQQQHTPRQQLVTQSARI